MAATQWPKSGLHASSDSRPKHTVESLVQRLSANAYEADAIRALWFSIHTCGSFRRVQCFKYKLCLTANCTRVIGFAKSRHQASNHQQVSE